MDKKRQQSELSSKHIDEKFQELRQDHNELVEMYHEYLKSLKEVDSVQQLNLYLKDEQKDNFNQLLQTIRKNLLKEQKEVGEEIAEGEIWDYID